MEGMSLAASITCTNQEQQLIDILYYSLLTERSNHDNQTNYTKITIKSPSCKYVQHTRYVTDTSYV
jgi:hypothetical protein